MFLTLSCVLLCLCFELFTLSTIGKVLDTLKYGSFEPLVSYFLHFKSMNMSANDTATDSKETHYPDTAFLAKVVSPFCICFGVFGNVLILLVIPRLGYLQAFSLYSRALSLSDLLYLTVSLLPRWIESLTNLQLGVEGSWLCIMSAFTHRYFFTASSLLLAGMTAQRAVGTTWPHKTRTEPYRTVAWWVIIITSTCAFFLQLSTLLFYGHSLTDDKCYFGSIRSIRSNTFGVVETWIFLTSCYVFPLTVIVCGSMVLLRSVHRSRKKSQHKTQTRRHKRVGSNTTTVVVLMTALTYCLLVSPYLVMEMSTSAGSLQSSVLSDNTWALVRQMMYANSAINFYLYCVFMGSKFREESKKVLLCKPSEIYNGLRRNKFGSNKWSESRMSHSYSTTGGSTQVRTESGSSTQSLKTTCANALSLFLCGAPLARQESFHDVEESHTMTPRKGSAYSVSELPVFSHLIINAKELDTRLKTLQMVTANAPTMDKSMSSFLPVKLFKNSPPDSPLITPPGRSPGAVQLTHLTSPGMSTDSVLCTSLSTFYGVSDSMYLPLLKAVRTSQDRHLSSVSSIALHPVYSSETLWALVGLGKRQTSEIAPTRRISSTW